jgi:glutamate-ammonia-ligase adenylyltransferase
MLESVMSPKDAAVEVETVGPSTWRVTVCAADSIGALSIISGLFAACHLNIASAEVFTFERPQVDAEPKVSRRKRSYPGRYVPKSRTALAATPPPRKLILDIFEVRALDAFEPEAWDEIESSLRELLGMLAEARHARASEVIIERVSRAVQAHGADDEPLYPVDIEVDDSEPDATVLTIESKDTLGFLFAFTNALTMFRTNIVRAEIRTIGDHVRDSFWLTESDGGKLTRPGRILELRAAAALIKHFTYLLPRSPNPALALRQFHALTQQILSQPDWTHDLGELESAPVLEVLANMMGVSQFLWEDFLRMQHSNLFPVLVDVPALDDRRTEAALRRTCRGFLNRNHSFEDQVAELNRFKDREMFRIDLRHITGRIDFRGFSAELTDLAGVVVEEAARLAFETLRAKHGTPMLEDGRPCPWSVCALGKFGGRELGYGSDIELIFVYEGEGLTDGENVTQTSRFMGDFVRTFLTVLKSHREGIFEIDLRLRPYGNGGPMASGLDLFRKYYATDGDARQFERLALVKLRHAAGDAAFGQRVAEARDEYVYSGVPVDVENIVHLRTRQAAESVDPGTVNAKYSPGGLVDMEYYVQACQIALGAADPYLRWSNTIDAIKRMRRHHHISGEFARELSDTYGFLRRLIDALRVVRGHAKDLTIPSPDTQGFAYLSQRLQFDSPEELQCVIEERMAFAKGVWQHGVPPRG